MKQSAFLRDITAPLPEAAKMREVQNRYEISTTLTEAVKRGNLSLACRIAEQMESMAGEFVRSENSLRNAQNLCIILNTQLRHALEDTRIHPYHLDRVSDEIARKIEQFRGEEGITAFYREILERYCSLAGLPNDGAASATIRLAVAYIRAHLTDNLTVKDAARELLVNPDYLSYRFHQEMGVGFIDFVNRERCVQAAALLKKTGLQIQQIALLTGYNNVSYFTRQFSRHYGCTPRDYRKSFVER